MNNHNLFQYRHALAPLLIFAATACADASPDETETHTEEVKRSNEPTSTAASRPEATEEDRYTPERAAKWRLLAPELAAPSIPDDTSELKPTFAGRFLPSTDDGIVPPPLGHERYPQLPIGISQKFNGFEGVSETAPWWTWGSANIEYGLGNARSGANNGAVRGRIGWHAIHWPVPPTSHYSTGQRCSLRVWLCTSANFTGGLVRVNKQAGPVVTSVAFDQVIGSPSQNWYSYVEATWINDGNTPLFSVGQTGNGADAWVRVDDVTISCQTPW